MRSFATVGFAGALVLATLTGAALAVFSAPGKLTPVPVTKAHSAQPGTKASSTNGTGGGQHDASEIVAPTARQ